MPLHIHTQKKKKLREGRVPTTENVRGLCSHSEELFKIVSSEIRFCQYSCFLNMS